MTVFGANRREMHVSMALVMGVALRPSMHIGFGEALLAGGAMTAALLCAINAALDMDDMGVIETYVAGLWLIAMIILTPLMLYHLATISYFK